jgi:hypothetical protein
LDIVSTEFGENFDNELAVGRFESNNEIYEIKVTDINRITLSES